jgi:hypothetical protein
LAVKERLEPRHTYSDLATEPNCGRELSMADEAVESLSVETETLGGLSHGDEVVRRALDRRRT